VNRRQFLLTSLASALAAPLAAEAQQSTQTAHRLGWLDLGSHTANGQCDVDL